MIHVFEGPNGAGKTTLAQWAGLESSLPVFYDAGRHGAQGEMTPREWMLTGTQHNLDVAEFSRISTFIVDRWALTSWACDNIRHSRAPESVYRRLAERAEVVVYLLTAPVDVLMERIYRRDTTQEARFQRAFIGRTVHGFRAAGRYFESLGVRVVTVDTNRSKEEVQDEVRSHWG